MSQSASYNCQTLTLTATSVYIPTHPRPCRCRSARRPHCYLVDISKRPLWRSRGWVVTAQRGMRAGVRALRGPSEWVRSESGESGQCCLFGNLSTDSVGQAVNGRYCLRRPPLVTWSLCRVKMTTIFRLGAKCHIL